jgi:predicted lysophospholipase L1 biosynthesis ABC-type transport system permease subunit
VNEGRIHFPISKAIAFSARSVRIRLGRMMVVVMGVASAVAFVVVLLALGSIMEVVYRKTGGTGGDMESLRKWWILVAVLIAVAGITNAILMSVTERIKEIGTIRCLGAMSRHVVRIFLFEAMFLGLVGGIVGGVLGLAGTYVYAILNYGWGLVHDALSLWHVLAFLGASLLGSMVLCVLSAVYPVYFAARLEPADAMRYEV